MALSGERASALVFFGSCVCIVKVLSALVSVALLLLVILNEVLLLNFRTAFCLEA